jgi:putative ABC transport system permease protein
MSMRFKIALRNVMRNRRRTILNVLMISAGIAAIVVFEGFAYNLIRKLENVAINTQFGHLQIASEKTWKLNAKDSPKSRLIQVAPEEREKIEKIPGVAYSSGRIAFYGLINNGEQSLSARGVAFDTGKEKKMIETIRMIDGRNLNADSKFEVIIGKGLRDQIGLEVGSQVTLLAQTFDGSVNAIDCELVGIFQSGLSEVDNSTFFIPLTTAQRLLDTDGIERLIIQLDQTADTEKIRDEIKPMLSAGEGIRTWRELAVYYRQVVDYFETQNMVIQWILMLLALLAIGNIVGMSIAERTGEIGTVRALGNSRRLVLIQFMTEGFILGVMGGVCGCVLGYFFARFLTFLKIPITTPGASLPFPMEVDVLPHVFVKAFIVMAFMAVVATLIPAIRASRVEIVEALKRNI